MLGAVAALWKPLFPRHTAFNPQSMNSVWTLGQSLLSVVGFPFTAYCSFFFPTLNIATICIVVLAPRIFIRVARVSYGLRPIC